MTKSNRDGLRSDIQKKKKDVLITTEKEKSCRTLLQKVAQNALEVWVWALCVHSGP